MRSAVIAGAGLLAALCAPAWAINKCTGPDGKVSFQDAPCATGKAEVLNIRRGGAPNAAPNIVPAPKAEAPATPPQPAGAAPQPAAPPQRARTEIEAEQCLDWYRPKLRDPLGAYYREPSKEGRVLSLTIYATNGYGGYVSKPAACEFTNGRIDNGWTKIHAKRGNWAEN
jgi:hypothetical protein